MTPPLRIVPLGTGCDRANVATPAIKVSGMTPSQYLILTFSAQWRDCPRSMAQRLRAMPDPALDSLPLYTTITGRVVPAGYAQLASNAACPGSASSLALAINSFEKAALSTGGCAWPMI